MIEYDAIIWIFEGLATLFFSISFYFQFYHNKKVLHGDGLSLNFQIAEVFAFVFYLVYNLIDVIFNDSLMESIDDLVFTFHAVVICSIVCANTYSLRRVYNTYYVWVFIVIALLFLYPIFLFLLNLNIGIRDFIWFSAFRLFWLLYLLLYIFLNFNIQIVFFLTWYLYFS